MKQTDKTCRALCIFKNEVSNSTCKRKKNQSITKNHIRDLFQFISSTSTFVTQKLGSRNNLIPIHEFVSKGNFSSDTFSS